MRLLRLELENFIAYRGAVEVDFSKALHDYRLLLITGPTGSGKSTLMDGILYALFGVGRRKRSLRPPVSQFAPDRPSRVSLEFCLDHDTFRVEREWRPRAGDWAETLKRWCKQEGNGWKEIDPSLLHRRFPLLRDFDLFRRVVVIPQGEYAHFINSQPKDRYALLESFLPLQWVEGLGRVLKEMFNEAQQERHGLSERMATLLRLEERPEDPIDGLPLIEERQKGLRKVKEDLEKRREEIEGEERLLKEARRALERKERLMEVLRDLKEAMDRFIHLKEREGEITLRKEVRNRLEEFAEVLQRDYQVFLSLEEEIEQGRRRREALERELKGIRERRMEIEGQARKIPEYRKERDTLLERIRTLGDAKARFSRLLETVEGLDDLRREVERARALSKAYREVESLVRFQGIKEEEEGIRRRLEALREEEAALEQEGEVLDSRHRDALIHELSSDLEPGKPCPVCGSTHHPSPYTPRGEVPSLEAILKRRQEMTRRFRELTQLRARLEERLKSLNEERKDLPSDLPDYQRIRAELREIGVSLHDDPAQTLKEWERKGFTLEGLEGDWNQKGQALAEREVKAKTLLQELGDLFPTARMPSPQTLKKEMDGLERMKREMEEGFKRLERHIEDLEDQRHQAEVMEKEVEGKLKNQKERLMRDCRRLREVKERLEKALKRARYHRTMEDLKTSFGEVRSLAEVRREIEGWESEFRGTAARYQKALEDLESLSDRSWEGFLRQVQRAGTCEEIRSAMREVIARLQGVDREVRLERKGLEERENRLNREREELAGRVREIQNLEKDLDEARKTVEEWRARRPRFSALQILTSHLLPPDFRYWVAKIYIQRVLQHASSYLEEFSDGRYAFYYISPDDKGLEILVEDRFTGEKRDARHLSGGEKFMVSLALALGMAHTLVEARGSEAPGFLFLDEGFGTLDRETLSRVAQILRNHARRQALDLLVISHRTELHDYFPASLEVIPSSRGSSVRLNLP